MGDEDLDNEQRLRRGRRWFTVGTLALVAVLVAGGAWAHSQVPAAVSLQLDAAAGQPVPDSIFDAHASLLTDRLAQAAGRTLDSLAATAPGPVANPAETQAPVVAGNEVASEDYARTLEELSAAEQAAAEDLAMSEQEAKQAEADRSAASKALADEEAAAAKEVDAAIEAAIAAAKAQSSYTVPFNDAFTGGGVGTGSIPSGSPTSTGEVLTLVRRYFPADQVGNAMAVSRCESGHANRVGSPNSNGTRDYGVFQINDGGTLQAALRRIGVGFSDITDARTKALQAEINVRMARAIWDSRGWQPWVCAAKLKVVAGLYQRNPGPMAGKYDEYGRAI